MASVAAPVAAPVAASVAAPADAMVVMNGISNFDNSMAKRWMKVAGVVALYW